MARNFILYLVCAIVLIFFVPGLAKIQELKSRNRFLNDKIIEVKKENLTLKKEVQRLKNDSVYLESVARDKMGVIKKGEVVYHIVGEEKK